MNQFLSWSSVKLFCWYDFFQLFYSKDFIRISDKNDKQVGPRYCGLYNWGFGVKINGDVANVHFSSNALIARKGFNASFEAILIESKGKI